MGWKESLRKADNRSQLLGIVLVLAILLSLPHPLGFPVHHQVLLIALMFSLGSFAWTLWYHPHLQWVFWSVSLVLSFVLSTKGLSPFPLLLLLLWAFWYRIRLKNTGKLKMLALLLLPLSVVAKESKESKKVSAIPIPAYLRGYKLNELISCGQIDKIPWKFRAEGRKTRLLLKDSLRLSTDTQFSNWEIHQVMDNNGYVSYIFRRGLKNGSFESIVAKENHFNRILESKKGRKTVEVQNLKNFINRSVFTFIHEDEGTVSYLPGLAGRSLITIQLSQGGGRLIPPLFVKGTVCDRPNGEDLIGDQSSGGTTDAQIPPAPAAAPAAGGAK